MIRLLENDEYFSFTTWILGIYIIIKNYSLYLHLSHCKPLEWLLQFGEKLGIFEIQKNVLKSNFAELVKTVGDSIHLQSLTKLFCCIEAKLTR